MRGKLARLFAYLTLIFLIAALATPWFKWNNSEGFKPNGGDRVTCWIDATCRTNSEDNTLIFKGGYRAQRFYDATLMLLVIPAVLMFLPLLAMIHKLNNRSSADSRLKGGLARTLIAILGLITLLAWISALIVFPLGIRGRYRPCDFQSNIPQWGCAGPMANQPEDHERLDELYGHRDVVFPVLVEFIGTNGTRNFTTSTTTEHVEWDVLSGWYLAMLATLFLIPTIIFGLIMKNKKTKVVTQTTTNTTVKEQYVAPVTQTGRAYAQPASGYTTQQTGGYTQPTGGYTTQSATGVDGYVPSASTRV